MKWTSLIKLLFLTCLQPTLCLEQDKVPSSTGLLCLTDEATLSTAHYLCLTYLQNFSPLLYVASRSSFQQTRAGSSDVLNRTMHYSYAII